MTLIIKESIVSQNILLTNKIIVGVDNLKTELDVRLNEIKGIVKEPFHIKEYSDSFDNLIKEADDHASVVGSNNIIIFIETPSRRGFGLADNYQFNVWFYSLH